MFRMNTNEKDFYDLFSETTEIICKSADMLCELIKNYTDIDDKINAIEETEHECDIQVHKILKVLNKTFITPIDREDIHLIAKELDNITDAIEATAHRFRMFNVESVTEDAIKLVELTVNCTNELRGVLNELKNMHKSTTLLMDKVVEVNRIEDTGDTIFRSAVAKLFLFEVNAKEIIKWKEIYEYLESTLDACEDVANIIEGVVMKHS